MRFTASLLIVPALILLASAPVPAQVFPTDDPVIEGIWQEGMENSQTASLAQVLMDSIGPRLAGSPEYDAAGAWLLATYERWGVCRLQRQQ